MDTIATYVFVYGSLLRSEPNHRLLASATFVGEARTEPHFSLVDLGAFPAMVAGGCTAVVGEVFAVDTETLARLDALEGVPRFYERVAIALDDGREVDAYLLHPHQVQGRPFIRSGSWRMRHEEKRP